MGEENETITADALLSWYDSRFGQSHRAAEYRLYFPTTDVSERAQTGDLLIIGKRTDGTLTAIIVAAGSTIENQVLWLFGVPVQTGTHFIYQDYKNGSDKEIGFAMRFILEEIGIEIEEPATDVHDALLVPFKGIFPKTREFSEFVRKNLKGVNPLEEPDKTLMSWMEFEENLFRRLERKIIDQKLKEGFVRGKETDVDGFIQFSLSVQNRRKARAGLALENHLEEIFRVHKIQFSRVAETENKTKPDFLFPSASSYRNTSFPSEQLTMLGVKTSCKDRWRQVLSEAARIQNKHLFTLEPSISENQTREMQAKGLQLVLPASIHDTYQNKQRSWLMSLQSFIALLNSKQKNSAQSGK
jgi:hypothetical protein